MMMKQLIQSAVVILDLKNDDSIRGKVSGHLPKAPGSFVF